ncbi:hypothetical protein [Streptomyces sp. NPDC047024]|uniref:hypothetical protein n=1 Tax=Streptomyces sp. NPDC047024 TaxID=3155476 RepID=UPI0033EF569B
MARDHRLTGLWVAVSVLFGLFIGAVAALLKWSDSHAVAAALLTGGTACGGAITLALVVINTLRRGTP